MLAVDPQAPRWSSGLVLVADRLDLSEEVRRAFAHRGGHRPDPYLVAAAERRFGDAADLAAAQDDLDVAADLRVVAAESLLEEGRSTEAAEQLEQALAFYRSVDGTRAIREIEAQLAVIHSTVG
jgi:hypothetical protein